MGLLEYTIQFFGANWIWIIVLIIGWISFFIMDGRRWLHCGIWATVAEIICVVLLIFNLIVFAMLFSKFWFGYGAGGKIL